MSSEADEVETVIHRQVAAARARDNPMVVARVESGWVVMGTTQFWRGYCLLLPDPVVPGLNDLGPDARRVFLSDMARLGDAIIAVCRPLRLNYAILGNREPALHAHVIPRYEHEQESLRAESPWAYPADVWTSPVFAFDALRHGELVKELRRAMERPTAKSPAER